MIIKDFKGFFYNLDNTKIPFNYLTGQSQNVFIKNNVITARKGFKLFGQAGEKDTSKETYSGNVWLTSGGVNNLFTVADKKFRVYNGENWVDLITLSNKERVSFAKWIDTNGAIIKDRLFFVDGSDNIYMWNGAIAKIKEIAGNKITIEGVRTLAQIGFDKGDTVPQTVNINGKEKTYTQADMDSVELELNNTDNISVGDYIIAKPIIYKNSRNLENFDKNFIFNYKNQLIVAKLGEERAYVSDMNEFDLSNGLNFTIPANDADRTIATPYMLTFDGGIQGIDQKRDKLRIFTENDIFVVRKRDTMTMGFYVDVYKQDTAYSIGSMPFATATFKGDLFYVSRSKTIELIKDANTQHEVETVKISKPIDMLLQTLDFEGVRLRVYKNYLILVLPKERKVFFYDIDEAHWNPPQILPINDVVIYEDKMLGLSTSGNEVYELFVGGSDNGNNIDIKIEFGAVDFNQEEYKYLMLKRAGFHCLMAKNTNFKFVERYFTAGTWKEYTTPIKGIELPYFEKEEELGIGTNPVATTGVGDITIDNNIVARTIVLVETNDISFILFSPLITISQKDIDFSLVSLELKLQDGGTELDKQYFIQKQNITKKIVKKL